MKLTLVFLTIAAFFQPLILFYWGVDWRMEVVFPVLGGLTTLGIVANNYLKKRKKPLIWSSIIFVIGFLTIQVSSQNIYVADTMLLMSKREEIVKKIKQNIKEDTVLHVKSLLPMAIKNNVRVRVSIKNEQHYDVFFPIYDDGFWDDDIKGVVYSDRPDELKLNQLHDESGLGYRELLTTRFIKKGWYFYTYSTEVYIGLIF